MTAANKELDRQVLNLSEESNPPRTNILVERPTGGARKSYPPVPYVSQK
ncbi:MAG: hypothetical protein E5W26_00345 [Mesorhizobium sp.]|nr:MAG: hypothetical protein E5W26_00345 [Mesorhizobium sp.]TIV62438.1 MAG: hypothetical protein E5V80_00500 [Mesorhizobium sp.]